MQKGFDWWNENVTNEIYINTNRSDWWHACDKISDLIKNARSIIDVGGGDGHTLWQILSVAYQGAPIRKVSFIEPSSTALKHAKKRLEQLSISELKLYKGTLETLGPALIKKIKEPFDVAFAGHTNYYFGKQARGKRIVPTYKKALALLPKLATTVILMTVPASSDYYKVVNRNPFGKETLSENVKRFYESLGYSVKTINAPMRFYVAHAFNSPHEAAILWKFFNDTENEPTDVAQQSFLKRLRAVMDRDGNLDFKDQLIVVTKKDRG